MPISTSPKFEGSRLISGISDDTPLAERLQGRLRELIAATTDEFIDQAPDRCVYPSLFYLYFGEIDLALAGKAQQNETLLKKMHFQDTYAMLLGGINFIAKRMDIQLVEITREEIGDDEICPVIVQVPLETQRLEMEKEDGSTLVYAPTRNEKQNPDGALTKELCTLYSKDTDIMAFGSAHYPQQGTSSSLLLDEVVDPIILRVVA